DTEDVERFHPPTVSPASARDDGPVTSGGGVQAAPEERDVQLQAVLDNAPGDGGVVEALVTGLPAPERLLAEDVVSEPELPLGRALEGTQVAHVDTGTDERPRGPGDPEVALVEVLLVLRQEAVGDEFTEGGRVDVGRLLQLDGRE